MEDNIEIIIPKGIQIEVTIHFDVLTEDKGIEACKALLNAGFVATKDDSQHFAKDKFSLSSRCVYTFTKYKN